MTPSRLHSLLPLFFFLIAACKMSPVDETGYLRPPDIDTTAEETPTDEEATRIFVVGNPGAVSKPGGLIKVTASSGDQAQVLVNDPEGSFVIAVNALQSDTLTLFYVLDGEDSIDLALDGTASRQEPFCATCTGILFDTPDADGNTSINLALFDDPNPPYSLYNQTKGIARRVMTVGIIKLSADTGDRICVYESGPEATSEALCDLVP